MRLGILGTLQLAATLIFAAPVAVFGLSRLAAGETLLGAGAVVVAVGMVALPQYLTTPSDLPGEAAERVVGAVVKEPEDDEN
ncbi:DUF7533 family protein [Halobellus sp. EA9]|uniref:DUF7533 family protein n=1 Tax=Halobellus sp. EA9 TaxID=3421647 RepID=UPI003EBB0613